MESREEEKIPKKQVKHKPVKEDYRTRDRSERREKRKHKRRKERGTSKGRARLEQTRQRR